MTERERLLKILNVPIYPHENVDPLEAAADYLLDNGVKIPVLCKDCKHWKHFEHLGCTDFMNVCGLANYMIGANGYCLYGERKDNA